MRHVYLVLLFIHFMYTVNHVNGLIGFDCSHNNINVTTIATDVVPGCHEEVSSPIPTEEVIQLIQLSDRYPLHVYQCKINVVRQVTQCGMHSHSSEVRGGIASYLKTITGPECKDMHLRRTMVFGIMSIDQLPINSSVTRVLTLAGSVNYDSSCKGTSYSDEFGSWDDVIVIASLQITLTDYVASADTTNDRIQLRSGVTCVTSQTECMDIENGLTTWASDSIHKCDERKHVVLYEGPSTVYKHNSKEGSFGSTYMVETAERIFGLRTIGSYSGCMFKAFTTEHPKLLIVPKTNAVFYFKQSDIYSDAMDIMAYVNTKFVYIEKTTNHNMADMYRKLEVQRCALERKTLQNLLALAVINPQEFAYTYMERAGYTSMRMGEVTHLIECVAVDVQIRETRICYNEIPVYYQNESMFISPRSRTLQRYGTEVGCDPIINAQFRLDGSWYVIGKSRHPVPSPTELTPNAIEGWAPRSINQLAKAGIYSYDDTEKLRERIMNPYERDAVANIITRGVTGQEFQRQGISLTALVDDTLVEDFSTKIGRKIWGFFSVFGNISAGFIGLYIILRIVKFLFDTVIHFKLIYEIYGFSLALVCSVWDSMTNYLVHRKKPSNHSDDGIDNSGNIQISVPEESSLVKQEGHIQSERRKQEQIEMTPLVGSAPPIQPKPAQPTTSHLYPNIYHNYSMP